MPRNHRIDVAYVGTRYHGWQVQPALASVQGVLEETLAALYGATVKIHGAGRTDAGVHARRQAAHFFSVPLIPPERLPLAANGRLPSDIRILRARFVPDGFHARKSAKKKTYCYTVYTEKILSPFHGDFAWRVGRPLDVGAMQEAGGFLLGRHDFTSFCAHADEEPDRVRTLLSLQIARNGSFLHFRFTGDGFLHHMVRNMVGTLIEVGIGKRRPADMPGVLRALSRSAAGPTAPAQGLALVRVHY